jgi:hypothetical protein
MSNSRVTRGRGHLAVDRIPYSGDVARQKLAGIRNVILVGAPAPVTFFAYPGKSPRPYPEDAVIHVLARPKKIWARHWPACRTNWARVMLRCRPRPISRRSRQRVR